MSVEWKIHCHCYPFFNGKCRHNPQKSVRYWPPKRTDFTIASLARRCYIWYISHPGTRLSFTAQITFLSPNSIVDLRIGKLLKLRRSGHRNRTGESCSNVTANWKMQTRLKYNVEYCGRLSKNAKNLVEELDDGHFVEFAMNDSNVVVGIKSHGMYKRSGEVPYAMREFAKKDKVKHLVLGSHNRFCILFNKLHPGCTGSSLKKLLSRKAVRCVAFGGKGVFVVLYKDGLFEGKGIPSELKIRLREGKRLGNKAVRVSMGSNGDYFVRFQDGFWCAHATDKRVSTFIVRLEMQSAWLSVKNITFGKRAVIATYVS